MPKLFEYRGLTIYFYSNEHEPIHVHGAFQGRESKAEILLENGEITEIRLCSVTGLKPLEPAKLAEFEVLVRYYAAEIVILWQDYFIRHLPIKARTITRRIR